MSQEIDKAMKSLKTYLMLPDQPFPEDLRTMLGDHDFILAAGEYLDQKREQKSQASPLQRTAGASGTEGPETEILLAARKMMESELA